MRRAEHEMNQRDYWRYSRRRTRDDWCRTALHSDLFERAHPDLVLEEIRRGPDGRLTRTA